MLGRQAGNEVCVVVREGRLSALRRVETFDRALSTPRRQRRRRRTHLSADALRVWSTIGVATSGGRVAFKALTSWIGLSAENRSTGQRGR